MSKGFCKVSHSGHGSVDYYLREGECLLFKHSQGYDKEKTLQHWQIIERNEKLGNKELGIRGRHDARVRTNYILSMPNSLSPEECISRVQSIIDKTPIKDCIYTTVVHKGEKDGITNQHVHLLVNERILSTQKKDREMQRKEWLDKSFKRLYEQEFKIEFSEGITVAPRERITQALFEADRKKSRAGILAHQRAFDTVLGDELLLSELKVLEHLFVLDQEHEAQIEKEQAERKAASERALESERATSAGKPLSEQEPILKKDFNKLLKELASEKSKEEKERKKDSPRPQIRF